MAKQRKRGPSRSRDEWARLVKAWGTSGLTAAQFAAQHGLKRKALSTWRWRLRTQPPPRRRRMEQAPPKLVQLSVADLVGSEDAQSGRWELTTVTGHRLRVLAPVTGAELDLMLGALVRDAGRR